MASGGRIYLPNGATAERLPSRTWWITDVKNAFCDAIGLRWRPGADVLPPHVLGHVGYTVVPWRRREGHAGRALRLLLPEARAVGLSRLDLTTDPENVASQRTILAVGGALIGRFRKQEAYGGQEGLLSRSFSKPVG